MICKICNTETRYIFNKNVLKKYIVSYHQCPKCKFIQTEKPYWLEECYNKAITDLDIGLVQRNIKFSKLIISLFSNNHFNGDGKYLDYAGGYGLFVRLMRDNGFNFYRQDIYCDNIFATHFDITDLNQDYKFEFVTAFEFFEHVEDPIQELKQIFFLTDTIIFSTELQPSNLTNWWYFIPEIGQHISFYNILTLEEIAKILNLNLYSNNIDMHILSKKKLRLNPFRPTFKQSIINKISKIFNTKKYNSLLNQDFEYIRNLNN